MRVLLCCLSLLVVHFSIETFKAKKTNEGKKTSVRRVSINKYIHVSLLDISKLRHTSLSLSLVSCSYDCCSCQVMYCIMPSKRKRNKYEKHICRWLRDLLLIIGFLPKVWQRTKKERKKEGDENFCRACVSPPCIFPLT